VSSAENTMARTVSPPIATSPRWRRSRRGTRRPTGLRSRTTGTSVHPLWRRSVEPAAVGGGRFGRVGCITRPPPLGSGRAARFGEAVEERRLPRSPSSAIQTITPTLTRRELVRRVYEPLQRLHLAHALVDPDLLDGGSPCGPTYHVGSSTASTMRRMASFVDPFVCIVYRVDEPARRYGRAFPRRRPAVRRGDPS